MRLICEPTIDYILPLPYGYGHETCRGSDGEIHPTLSVMSNMAIDAAVIAQNGYPNAKLVLVGEGLGQSLAAPSTVDLLIKRAIDSGIEKDAIINLNAVAGKPFNNTATQVKAAAKFSRRSSAALLCVSLAYHQPRVMDHAQGFGLNAQFQTAEAILEQAGVNTYKTYAQCFEELGHSERWLRRLTRVDKRGYAARALSALWGTRFVDCILDGDATSQPRLVNSYAREVLIGQPETSY